MNFTADARARLEAYLETHELSSGLGSKESACSVAAINLAISGELIDKIPDCMSKVVGKWVIMAQDAMPHAIRNGAEWKRALVDAAGTGRNHEHERLAIILDWMWSTVLPTIQPIADDNGFGGAWARMTKEKTMDAACTAHSAIVSNANNDYAAVLATRSVRVSLGSNAAFLAACATAQAAAYTADAVGTAAWEKFNPAALLEKLNAAGAAIHKEMQA